MYRGDLNLRKMKFIELFKKYEEKTMYNCDAKEYIRKKKSFFNFTEGKTEKENIKSFYKTIETIGDNHSFVIPKSTILKNQQEKNEINSNHIISKINDIIIIEIPGVFNTSKDYYLKYISDQKYIHKKNMSKYQKGIIIDLRNNTGGNLWAMIASISFLFPNNQVLGYFLNNENNQIEWGIKNNNIYENNITHFKKLETSNNPPKIAVIIGENTVSSGEALAIALTSNKNIKLFGNKTGGYTSSNEEYLLSDGTILFVSEAYFADSNKTIFKKGVKPNVETKKDENTLIDCYNWLKNKNE